MSALDPVIGIIAGFYSFVSKADVRKMPVFGITAWALQGIFVKRDGSKQDVTA